MNDKDKEALKNEVKQTSHGISVTKYNKELVRREFEQLQAENAKLRECLSNWLSWEQKQINTHGEYCGEEIKKLISDARKVLKELDNN